MKELLKTLCALNGVSGDEDQVREFLAERARPWARSMKVDPLGNLIVWKKGARAAGDRLMLCAHMDEVGLIVTHVTEEGFLKFDFVGGVDRRVAIGKPVVLGPDRVPGVVGIKAIHLVSRDEEKKVPKTDAFYLDIGARDREEALSRVEPGTYGSFVCTPEEFGEGLFKAKAIDDRVGCAVLLKLLEEDLPMDVVFVFTAQEEVGTRGAFGAAFSVAPETALVLETTTAADLPGVEGHRRVCAPGRGPVISYMDGGTIYDRGLFEDLRRLAEDNGIPWQTKEYIAGGNDARTIQRSRAGVRVAALLPRICTDREAPALFQELERLRAMGVTDALAGTLDSARRAAELGFTLRGDYGLGVFNGQTLKELKRLGFRSATLSFELKLAQIRDLSKGLDTELVVYGRLPLMITENCIIHNHSGRHTCANVNLLTDRKGERFPVVKAPGCRNEILNSKKLFLADKAGDWQRLGLWAGRLMFTTENARECVQVLERYLGRGSYQPNDYTRGLYYRGVE